MKIVDEFHRYTIRCDCGARFSVTSEIEFVCCARCARGWGLDELLEDRRRQQVEADEEAEKNG